MQQRRFEFLLRAETPISHAQETFGNTQTIMRSVVIQPDGSRVNVPIITGDTMRHGLRESAAWLLLEAAGIAENKLTEAALRLLFAGGMVTGSSGSGVSLDAYRRLVELIPPLALLGGCASNRVLPGRLAVDQAVLVCTETVQFMPPWVREYIGETRVNSCRAHVENVQRVRMDPTLDPGKRGLLLESERAVVEGRLLSSEEASTAGDAKAAQETKSSMMPFTYERVAQGSLFFWGITVTSFSDLDMDTFTAMVGTFLRRAIVGGKKGTGHGLLKPVKAQDVRLANFTERSESLEIEPAKRVGDLFRAHVAERKQAIGDLLATVAA